MMMRYDNHFRLAHELGKTLNDLMGWDGSLTHRQFVLWNLWLDKEMDIPSKDNFYQMQVACEVRRSVSKNPAQVSINSFKLVSEIKDKDNNIKPEEKQKREIDETKQILLMHMTAPVTVKKGEETEIFIPPSVKRKQIQDEQEKLRKESLSKQPNKSIDKPIEQPEINKKLNDRRRFINRTSREG